MKRVFQGGCQCGSVRYRYEGEVLNIFACHCMECQKQSGSAFGMGLWVEASGLERLSGTLLKWTRHLPTGEDMVCEFCDQCGTRVFHVSESYRAKGIVSIKPGTIDDTSWIQPRAQIWLERTQPWLAIEPGSVTYPRNPPSIASLAELPE
jgi:hypothetical protein